jgi:hypothetical protein
MIFRALDPEGREVYPRGKVRELSWSFTAERPGTYILEFDNTYSTQSVKLVDVAIAMRPLSLTITTITMVEFRILTVTVTEMPAIPPLILSQEGKLILALVAMTAFMTGILLALFVRKS